MRIIHVVRALRVGGLETLVLDLCTRMAECTTPDIEVKVCALLSGDGLESRPEYRGVTTITLPPHTHGSKLCTVLGLAGVIRRERPDVVHTHNLFAHVYGAAAARVARVPVVVSTKHGWRWYRLLHSRTVARYAWGLADMVVTVSRGMRQGFIDAHRYPPAKARYILNGVNTARFRPVQGDYEMERKRVLNITGSPLLGTVGRLVEDKGISTLLDAFATLRHDLPGASLVVVGDGPYRHALETRAHALGISDSVFFLGMRSDLASLYPVLDLFVLPSYTEGISMTILEAASCELPIVATDVGGTPEIVEDGRTGRLAPPRDPRALAEAIRDQWRNIESAHTMGRAARDFVIRRFSLDRMAREYIDLYQEILRTKRST